MNFKTQDQDLFNKMIVAAIKSGLTFDAYDKGSYYIIKYTGGY